MNASSPTARAGDVQPVQRGHVDQRDQQPEDGGDHDVLAGGAGEGAQRLHQLGPLGGGGPQPLWEVLLMMRKNSNTR